MKPPVITNLGLGSGIPKTIVPLTGANAEDVLAQAQAAVVEGADCVEWRIDYFDGLEDADLVLSCLSELHKTLDSVALLVTIRSSAQGGSSYLSEEATRHLQESLITSGAVDLIDIELTGEASNELASFINFAHECGVAVVVSDHNFASTPAFDVLYATLEDEYKLGADICKVAVMAKQEGDELQLMAAAHQFVQDHPEALTIAISMGELGAITRLAGEFFGSCMTFCTVGAASALGQVDLATAKRIMNQLHEEGLGGFAGITVAHE